MTSHELAKKLLELPDVMVTVRGYEGGVDEIRFVNTPRELALDVNEEWYYGKHEYVDYDKHEDKQKIQAIAITS
jgi:hypothetical protein